MNDGLNQKTGFFAKEGVHSVIASVLSILIGMLVGGIMILIVGALTPSLNLKSAWEGIRLVIAGVFSTGRDAAGELTFGFNSTYWGNLFFRATPVIMTGLSVALANKTGLFNIGAPGQYLMGTMATLVIALGIPAQGGLLVEAGVLSGGALPAWIVWILAFLGGMLAGAIWGAIPGLLKALLNINEVLACIMTNWIAANLVTWFFGVNTGYQNIIEKTKTTYIYKTAYNNVVTPKLGLDKLFPDSQVNGGIIIAIVLAILVYILMSKTTFGFELKACGSNRFAARYAGIKDKRNIVMSMAIAGALAAAGASLYWLSGNTEFSWNTYQSLPAVGFNGIPVALLAINNPIGVIFSGLFMALLDINGTAMTFLTAYNEYITDVIIAVIVYLSAFSLVFKMAINKLLKPRRLEGPRGSGSAVKAKGAN